ncbi:MULTISPECIES: hypothetical protein [unclassified Nonomuraea]|nr:MULTISPECIES: hypothetical protein [unclassified Nonomuraea]
MDSATESASLLLAFTDLLFAGARASGLQAHVHTDNSHTASWI